MTDKKISLEKRELMGKRNLLTKAIEKADMIAQFFKDVKEISEDSGISEDYLKEWVLGELKQVFNVAPLEVNSDSDEDEDEDDKVEETEEYMTKETL